MVRIHPDPPITGTRNEAAGRKAGSRKAVEQEDGAVAQLGERLLCKQEVVGSIPSSSTSIAAAPSRKHYRLPQGSGLGISTRRWWKWRKLIVVLLFNNQEGKALMDLMRVRQR